MYGSYGTAVNSSTGTVTSAYGSYGYAENTGTGTMTNAYGAWGWARNSSTGTLNNATGVYAQISNNNASSTISNAYGFYYVGVNNGTITNSFDIYLNNGGGTITNNYGIYQADTGTNYLAGSLGVGLIPTTAGTASAKLQADLDSTDNSPLSINTPTLKLSNFNTTAGNYAGIEFTSKDTAGSEHGGAMIDGVFTHGSSMVQSDLSFYTRDSSGNVWNPVYMTSGNVGIGTTSPQTTLDVNGGVRPVSAAAAWRRMLDNGRPRV